MKYFIIFSLLVAGNFAQRPTYAGSKPKGRPELASRFRDPNETETITLANRVGEGSTAKIPVDARGDSELVDRLNQWPREHRPFWLLNAEHIEASRNKNPSDNIRNGNNIGNLNDSVNQLNRVRPTSQAVNLNVNDDQDFIDVNDSTTSFQSRSNFDFEPNFTQDQTRPIRPNEPRSSFLGALQ